MNASNVYKIKDSVDLFLSNENYIMAYYMNTRQRKSFRVNKETVHLLEHIDGIRTLEKIKNIMYEKYNVNPDFVDKVVGTMLKNHIITIVNKDMDILPKDDMERYSRQINYFSEFLESEVDGIKAQKNN